MITCVYEYGPSVSPEDWSARRRLARSHEQGNIVVERRVGGGGRGVATRRLMARAYGWRTPVSHGYDLTNEEGFEAARALDGAGILVGERWTSRSRLCGFRSDTLIVAIAATSLRVTPLRDEPGHQGMCGCSESSGSRPGSPVSLWRGQSHPQRTSVMSTCKMTLVSYNMIVW